LQQEVEDLDMLIDVIQRGATRTKEIVSGLKTFSHLQQSSFKDIDLNEGLRSTLLLLGGELKKGPIDVEADYGEIGLIEGNAGEINQVFMNLLSNAIQAISGRGAIRLSTRRVGGEAIVSISDTGCGMSKDVMEKVFDPFYTTKDVGKGTGLGLSISHGIVERHAGRIEVESKPGEGTTFRVILPVRQPSPSASAA
ncbi:MAG: HAMP domain-containing histidine kinase, partial [Candidatus Methylomirabilis sp.]|nr:HAMP domain-containing histidine kinase [Deltaproteobacteria bacterium]